jgi:hypothetical protein
LKRFFSNTKRNKKRFFKTKMRFFEIIDAIKHYL